MMLEILDSRLASVVHNSVLERLCTGAIWSEGPVWLPGQEAILWSDIPNNRMLRWSENDGMTVWRDKAEFANGHTLDLNGDLLHCSHGLRAIVRTPRSADGTICADTVDEIVVDRYLHKRLNSPNDVVVKRDGTIWFTDPPYGILSDKEGYVAQSEQAENYVFCFDPKTNLLRAASYWVQEPNGLAFSPDESLLYVSDTSAALASNGAGNHHIAVFEVDAGNILKNPRVFAVVHPGLADGFKLDSQEWIYTSSADSVQIYHPNGMLLGKIHVPEKVGNMCFGGLKGNELYIAASTSLYRIVLNTTGNQAS